MLPPKFVSFLTFLLLCKMAQMSNLSPSLHQERRFISAHIGGNVTLKCFFQDNVAARLYWYKQTLGEKPRLISSIFISNTNGVFYGECKNNPRCRLVGGNNNNQLTITDLRISDSATYYCAIRLQIAFEFAEGTTVSVRDSGLNIQAQVHQSTVSLNCTVHTGTCDGEHSIYWFRNSEESNPGLIYTHGDRNGWCERTPDTHARVCHYNLPAENYSDAGTYYCAVASCGRILFGNWTKLEETEDSLAFYFLSGVLTFTIILCVLLAFSLCMMRERHACNCKESHAELSASTLTNAEYQTCTDRDDLHYAALRVKKADRMRRQRSGREDGCVYASVKQ